MNMKKLNPSKSAMKMHDESSGKRAQEVTEFKGNESETQFSDAMKRRKFLGMGLLGFAGMTLPLKSKADSQNSLEDFVKNTIAPFADKTTSQTDSIQEKIQLLQEALTKKDYRTARALTNSIRISEIQSQAEEEDFGIPHVGAGQFGTVDSLPVAWKGWAKGWKYYKVVGLEEKLRNDVVEIYKEADELLSITVASFKTLRKNQNNRKSNQS
jgi:hypothetical protein